MLDMTIRTMSRPLRLDHGNYLHGQGRVFGHHRWTTSASWENGKDWKRGLPFVFVFVILPFPSGNLPLHHRVRSNGVLCFVDRLVFLWVTESNLSERLSANIDKIPYFNLRQETAVRRNAIPSILYHVQCVLPGQIIVLHREHHDECRRQTDST
jgi:hypothetical protein